MATSLAFACFSADALVARRREYLYLGGLLSSWAVNSSIALFMFEVTSNVVLFF